MIIVGAGGHAKDLLTVFSEGTTDAEICFFDNIGPLTKLYNYHVLKTEAEVLNHFKTTGDTEYVIGVGGVQNRIKVNSLFERLGGTPVSVISKRAIVGNYDVKLGKGLNIMHNVFISNSVAIGDYSLVNYGATLHHDVKIGNFCEISPMVQLLGNAKVGNRCFIGAGAIIFPGVKVHDDAVIGAGSVVNKDVDSGTKIYGVPAKAH